MIIYILVALFPLLVGRVFDTRVAVGATEEIVGTKKYQRLRWRWLMIAALPMFALIALRGRYMGADTSVYLKFFDEIINTPWNRILIVNDATYEFEPGFVIFEKLVSCITKSSEVYQVIYSSIYFLAVVSFANQLDKGSFSFLYFFATMGTYTFMFTGVRQCLAMSICLFSYSFIKKRKLIPFLLLLILAFTFHKSAILFIAAYFIYNRKIGWINTAIYAIFGGLAFVYIDVIQEWFNDNLDYDYGIESTGNGVMSFVIIALITAVSFFMILAFKKQTKESVGLLNVGVITLIMWILRLVTRVAERPSFYFMFFSAAMLCYALDAPNEIKEKRMVKFVAYCAFMLLFIYKFMTSFATLVPYTTFF